MAKVKSPSSSLTIRCTSVTAVTLETVWSNLCSARPRHSYNVFYEPQHILSHISLILDPPAIFLAFCCTLLRLAFYFEPCSILRLSGPQYWLKSCFLARQRLKGLSVSLSHILPPKKWEQHVKRCARHERSQMWQCHISVAKPEKIQSKLCCIVELWNIAGIFVPQKREVSELVSENNGPVAGRILDEMIANSLSLAKRSWRITATVYNWYHI
jgi:hypothetical protein